MSFTKAEILGLFTKTLQTLTDSSTITWAWNGNPAKVTITANRTLNITGITGVQYGTLEVIHDTAGTVIILPGDSSEVNWKSGADETTLLGFYYNGIDYIWASQVSRDVNPPLVISATAINATTIRIVFNEFVTATNVGWSFKKNGSAHNPSAISGSGTNTLDFTVGAMIPSDTLLRSYDSSTGDTVDLSDNELVSFTDQAITNDTLSDIIFSTGNGLAVTGTTWRGLNTGAAYNNFGVGSRSIASGQDGWIQARFTASDGTGAIGFDSDNTSEQLGSPPSFPTPLNWEGGAYVFSGTLYYFEKNVAVTSTGVSMATGDYWRIYRAGSVWKVQKSTNGTTWTDAVTLVYTGTGQIYLKANIDNATIPDTKIYEPKGYNIS